MMIDHADTQAREAESFQDLGNRAEIDEDHSLIGQELDVHRKGAFVADRHQLCTRQEVVRDRCGRKAVYATLVVKHYVEFLHCSISFFHSTNRTMRLTCSVGMT